MLLRKLNEQGVKAFEMFIYSQKSGSDDAIPFNLLSDDTFSEQTELSIDIEENRRFDSRFQMGVYLVELFSDVEKTSIIGDHGLWTWLALVWFEQLCPLTGGKMSPYAVENYSFSNSFGRRTRHAVYMTWNLVDLYGEDVRFMLCKEPNTRGEITEQLMGTQDILYSDAVIRVASLLYLDEKTGMFKRGAAARKSAGCIARYIKVIKQLKVNYDMYSISKAQLASLLPDEFSRFRGGLSD